MTKEELNALIQLLNRASMSVAEQLWTQGLISRLERLFASPKDKPKQEEDNDK